MLTTLYLMRHAQTQWNIEHRAQGQADSPLTPLGEQQAIAAGEYMRSIAIDQVVCSPLGRTRRTLELALAGREIATDFDEAWMEIDFGHWEGKTFDEIGQDDPDCRAYFDAPHTFDVPGIESPNDCRARMVAAFQSTVLAHAHQTVWVVSHGAALRQLVTYLQGLSVAQSWDVSVIANCQIIKVNVHDGGYALDTVFVPD
ncbi:MAG: histidine phosphatase family protein [Gammaproteobacteria bacterium]|nr:histidine phosphatase family protein [Gammaproteobacteria bacterium]